MSETLTIRTAQAGSDDDAVCSLMTHHLTWALGELETTYGVTMDIDARPSPESLGGFRHPHGLIVLAELDATAVGVGALRTLSDHTVEVKRMYVEPIARSRHVGSAILDYLLDAAGNLFSAKVVLLDTCRFMTDAQRLYASRGFVERSPYPGTEIPPELQQYWRFYSRPR